MFVSPPWSKPARTRWRLPVRAADDQCGRRASLRLHEGMSAVLPKQQ